MLILELTSVFADITIINDEYNYMCIWCREFLSQIVPLSLEVVSMLLLTQILMSDDFNWVKLAGLIGMGFHYQRTKRCEINVVYHWKRKK